MSADWPFVQVIIREFGVSGGSRPSGRGRRLKEFQHFREVLFATYSAVCN
jgi:hypothetical protein